MKGLRLIPRDWSIRTLLVGQFLLVVLAAVVVVALLVVFWRLPLVRDQAHAEQNRLADMAQYQIEINLDLAQRQALDLAHTIQHNGPSHPLTRQAFDTLRTQPEHRAEGLFQGVYLLDKRQRVINLGGRLPAADWGHWLHNDLSGLEVVRRASDTARLTWSDRYNSPVLGVPVVAMALPLDEGLLVVELAVDRLARAATEAVSLDGVLVLLVDAKAEVIAAPDRSLADVRTNLARWAVVAEGLRGAPTHGAINLGDQWYQGTTRHLPRLGWMVFAGLPQSVVDASRNASIGITAITLVLAVGIGLGMFLKLSTLIQRRMEAFGVYALAVSQGRFESNDRRTGILEIDALDASLQQMALTIQRREHQLRSIVDTTPTLAIQWFDREGRVVDWNPASEAILGWRRDEALGQTLDRLIYTPEQQVAFLQVMAEIERTGQAFGPYEGEVRNRLGERRVLLSTTFGVPDVSGKPLFVCMDVDITDLKRKEEDVRASEQKFNLFFQASPVAVAVVEDRGPLGLVHVDVNRSWENLFRLRKGDVLDRGLRVTDLLRQPTGLEHRVAELAAGTVWSGAEEWMLKADGEAFLAQAAVAKLLVDARPLLIYAVNDITAQRQAEQELRDLNTQLEERIAKRTETLTQANRNLEAAVRSLKDAQDKLVQADKLASLGSLVAGVAHELNTPIGNGLMAVSTLAQRVRDFRAQMAQGLRRSDLERLLSHVDTASDISTRNLARASELISSFKQVAVDQTSSQRRKFDLQQVVQEILLTLQPTYKHSHIQVTSDVPAGVVLDSYPGPLGQALSNLVQNALTHAFAGRDSGRVMVHGTVDGESLCLTVEDDGVGIAPENLGKVFDPFFTTRLGQGGSGLGLNIVHNIVTGLLGGEIEVRCPDRGGTVMAIRVPRVAPQGAGANGLSAG